MTILKSSLGLICVLILASNIVTMSRWSETRGVYDDLCYLRQAHLFQRFGVSGLDTSASRDDDGFMAGKLKGIGFAGWSDPKAWPCHTPMPAGKSVLQYPPGTGFVLALFPQGFQVTSLYIAANLIVCGFALFGIFHAQSPFWILSTGGFGALATYLMISPGKASYSIAPTMALCAVAGFLTALWLVRASRSVWPVALLGLLLGLSVNVRLPNLFLAAGYALYLGVSFLWTRKPRTFAQGVGFAGAFVLGMAPTLIANAINAGSPFATTYGGVDAVAPAFDPTVLRQYLGDMQFALILATMGSIAWLWRMGTGGAQQVALLCAANLAVNLAFFLSHPIFTPYYVVPVAMLSLWTLSFGWIMQSAVVPNPIPLDPTAKTQLQTANIRGLQ
ncbi:hypothetical protein [Bradyrhizobium sp.]|uniref:hypothetical protein n=1 Tax=Bradyrhizobium sp. TaxID=376 RepID=UPI00238B1B4A|nr:hypothetical protein [Bradyrhizobium sp.]MDE2380284.1 hypothetical protein [Bradyrhizobium sp.]